MHKAQQIPLDLGGRSAQGREDFLIGPSNADAVAWIDRWPDWPAPLLIVSGPVASGKSHLAAVWRDKADAAIVDAQGLVNMGADEIAALAPHIMIDGIDLSIGLREAEETLFHLYNMFKEGGRSFLVTTRLNVAAVDFVIADLASRMRAAPVAMIREPDDMLLRSVLIKLFSDRQLKVGNEVIKYILPRMERSFDAARDLVKRTDQAALSQKRRVSVPLVRSVMG